MDIFDKKGLDDIEDDINERMSKMNLKFARLNDVEQKLIDEKDPSKADELKYIREELEDYIYYEKDTINSLRELYNERLTEIKQRSAADQALSTLGLTKPEIKKIKEKFFDYEIDWMIHDSF